MAKQFGSKNAEIMMFYQKMAFDHFETLKKNMESTYFTNRKEKIKEIKKKLKLEGNLYKNRKDFKKMKFLTRLAEHEMNFDESALLKDTNFDYDDIELSSSGTENSNFEKNENESNKNFSFKYESDDSE